MAGVGRDQNCTMSAGKMEGPDLNESFKMKMTLWDLHSNFQIVCYSVPDLSETDNFFPLSPKCTVHRENYFFFPSLAGQAQWF